MSFRVAVDASSSPGTGAGTLMLEAIERLRDHPEVSEVLVFHTPIAGGGATIAPHPKIRELPRPLEARSLLRRLAWYERGLARACREHEVQALLCMSAAGAAPGIPTATVFHQSLPYSPEASRTLPWKVRAKIALLHASHGRYARRADRVVVPTSTMASWFREHHGIPEDRLRVILSLPTPPPPAPQGAALEALEAAPGPRILYVGNTFAYKNLPILVEAMTRLRSRGTAATAFLTCPPGHPLVREGVVALGALAGPEVQAALRKADVLVLPSLVEAGALTILEAMEAGTPVVVTDRPWARDIAGDAATYFDPTDPEALVSALEEVTGAQRSAVLRERGPARIRTLREEDPLGKLIEELRDMAG